MNSLWVLHFAAVSGFGLDTRLHKSSFSDASAGTKPGRKMKTFQSFPCVTPKIVHSDSQCSILTPIVVKLTLILLTKGFCDLIKKLRKP